MGINPTRLMAAIAKGEIVMPEGAKKSTQRLVLIAIVARVDNDDGKIPDGTGDPPNDFRVSLEKLAGDVGHKATANALKPLEENEYVKTDRADGRGEKLGIRLGPKLMNEEQWPRVSGQAKKHRQNDQAKPRQNDQAKKHRQNDQATRQNDQAKPRQNDQATRQNDQAKPRQNDQASPYVSSQVSAPMGEKLLGQEHSAEPYEQFESAEPYEDRIAPSADPIEALRQSLNPDPEIETEVRVLKDSIALFIRERRSNVPDHEEQLVQVMLVSRTEAIKRLSPIQRASIPDHVWERAQQHKPT